MILFFITEFSDSAVASKSFILSGVFCSRYGGDEFVIIYEGLTEDETLKKARTLKENIVRASMEHKYSPAADVVTISQGVCWDVPKAGQTAADFLHTADNLLYEVKKVSRNSIKIGRID